MSTINWFIGHMAKSTSEIQQELSGIDLIIQIADARSIKSSINDDLIKLANNKPIVNVALKADLADIKENNNFLITSINNNNIVNLIKNKINKALETKIKKLKTKGLVNPHFYLIVVGLPNIGKSSLINKFASKNKVEVQNRPGVTRKVSCIKIDKHLSIYDTPGIMVKKIENDETGYILGTLGCIDQKVLPLDKVVEFNTNFYFKNYEQQIRKYFDYDKEYQYHKFIDDLGNKLKFITKNNKIDYQRLFDYLFNIYKLGKSCKVNYDK